MIDLVPYVWITFAGVAVGVTAALAPLYIMLMKNRALILSNREMILPRLETIETKMETHDVGCQKLIGENDMLGLSNSYLSAQVLKLEAEITELKDNRGF